MFRKLYIRNNSFPCNERVNSSQLPVLTRNIPYASIQSPMEIKSDF